MPTQSGNNISNARLLVALVNSFPDHIYVKDTDSRFLLVNQATAQLLGASTPDQVIGKTDFDFFPRPLAEDFRGEEIALLRAAKMVLNREAAIPDSTGGTRWVLTTKVPLCDDQGQVVGLLGVNRDITERKRAEEKLLKLSRAVEQSATLVIICDTRGDIEYVNPKFTEVTGYTPEEIAGKNVRILKSGQTPTGEYARLWDALAGGQEWKGQFYNKKKNGEFYWVSVNISPIRNGGGVVTHFVSVQEDITERKRVEQRLRQLNDELARKQQELLNAMEALKAAQAQLIDAEKMETVGRLAAGVAHEVKNPLAMMRLGLEYIRDALGENQTALKETVTDMTAALVRADVVVAGLLNLAASHEVSRRTEDIHVILEQCLALLRHAITRAQVRVVREFASGLPPVHLDRLKIEQVFINLILNAIHAMTNGGTLTLRTFPRQIATEEAPSDPGDRSGERLRSGDAVVVVEIDDTGIGIPEDKLSKVFDPFFTTKSVGKGTGLGLTVAKKIVEVHGGTVNICNRAEGGVRATVMLKTQHGENPHDKKTSPGH